MKKVRPHRNIYYGWLINYVPDTVRTIVDDFKDKIFSLFKTNTPKEIIINSIRNLFIPKKKRTKRKKIRRLFKRKGDYYYEQKRVNNFWNNN